MRCLAVILSNGGVGKTMTAVSLAHGLARDGARVLLRAPGGLRQPLRPAAERHGVNVKGSRLLVRGRDP